MRQGQEEPRRPAAARREEVRRGPFLFASAALLLCVLTGCGGGGATATEASTAGDATPPPGPPPQSGHSSKGGSGAAGGGGASGASDRPAAAAIETLKVSGGGSAQFRVKGGDNSVQDYGAEAGESELRRAAGATHAFFVARARGDWERACGLLSAETREGLEQLASGSADDEQGCPAMLSAVTAEVSPAAARALTSVDAASLRRAGNRAFLIYTGPPGRTVYSMPLVLEAGSWKLGSIGGAVLPGT